MWIDVSLTIEPGVNVVFDADVPFYVSGSIKAVGTEMDSIRFIPGLSPEWVGLKFASGDSSTFDYVRVSGGRLRTR